MASQSATQDFVPIENIRDGIVTLKNGELRSVLITSSLNLSLKSDDEQQAILFQFQNLLNSLEFPVQFFVQSRRLNIKPYIELLTSREKEVSEDLLKIQIREYMGFIQKFTEDTNIMTKHFFVVVPYLPPAINTGSGSMLDALSFGKDAHTEQENINFESARIQLEQRISAVSQGLSRIGVRAQKLGTEEVVELFYKLFNPGEQDRGAPKLNQ